MKLFAHQQGSILLPFIITLPFLIAIVGFYMNLSVNSYQIAHKDQANTYAQFATDAGLDQAIRQVNLVDGYTGSGGQVELHNDGKVRTTYETTVTDVDSDTKNILSIGRSYRPAGSATPNSTVRVNVSMRPVTSGEYSVVSGVGGLIMSNSAKILGGDVLINGKVSLTNSAQIGLSTNPVNLQVGHQSCPVSGDLSSYPRVCRSGENGQPISLSNSAKIYGSVKANNQTSGTSMQSPGLLSPLCPVPVSLDLSGANCVTPQGLPPHDRAAQITTITNADNANSPDAMTGSAASCTNSGTKIWPANLKINGNVSISNGCKVTVQGDVWITGRLNMTNSSEMIVSNALGATRPVIMVDGDKVEFGNSSILRSNSSNTGFMVVNYKSDSACTTQVPGCANLTGSGLSTSKDDVRIELDNSASGPHTIFYARWGKVLVKNSGQIGALVGQTVELSNSGTITFGTSTGVGTSFWIVDDYRRIFN